MQRTQTFMIACTTNQGVNFNPVYLMITEAERNLSRKRPEALAARALSTFSSFPGRGRRDRDR